MAKITKTVAANGDVTLTEVATTLIDDMILAVGSPFKVFQAEDTEFYSPSVAGYAFIGAGVGGVWVGDKFGASIPLLGGRRI